ncbi:MAG: T9SS type A sorting domain-containing protein [Ignavibacteriae bacterium]|nr:T9SS type A sorting domain-containing protein [Ignavibacteriota bacterium]
MGKWIDQTWSTNPTQGSLTHYFNEMSYNKFKFTGKEIHVVTNKTRAEYDDLNMKRFDIHKELLQSIDATENFANYDKWKLESNYLHTNTADTKVDMIIFVWRNITKDVSGINYESVLGFGNNYGDLGRGGDISVDSGARKINTDTWGSGVTVKSYFGQDPFRIALHEFNHYLLGHNNMHNGYGYWGMLADWGTKSYTINAFEMYQLQWAESAAAFTIDATNSSVETITKSIGDFLTTNKAIRVKYDADKYFYIENHQKTSYWESHAPFSDHPNSIDGTIENGIYIIRQEGLLGTGRECIPADGRYDWEAIDKINNPYDQNKILPVWKNFGVDKTDGHHSLENKIVHNYPGCTESSSSIYFVKNPITNLVDEPKYYLGNGLQAFRIGYQQIFSPWSNPNNQNKNKNTLNFTFSLNYLNNGIATISIFKNNPIASNPSKPQNLKITSNGNHPLLTWNANDETDLSGYVIWRKEGNSNWLQIATTTKFVTSYSDNDVTTNIQGYNYFYKITAFDTQSKISVYSNEVSIRGVMYKSAIEDENSNGDELPTEYKLSQNYPNPFNPSTKIVYDIPKNNQVSLMVYNSLGKEVSELVNGFKQAGSYSVTFDASNLPSGVYFYKLQAGEYNQVNKMILLK